VQDTDNPRKTSVEFDHLPGSGAGGGIDKSVLAIGEPRRYRDKAHRKFVGSQPCLICGRQPSDPHHLRSAQPRALGRKVSDEFTVPLCRIHHREVHRGGDEGAWWDKCGVDPYIVAAALWARTRPVRWVAEHPSSNLPSRAAFDPTSASSPRKSPRDRKTRPALAASTQ
jgi:hypothetical protein